ncbi:protein-L-isoaspartate(D-aspartate) O-methyltransferase [Tistrella mobilis]|uniref:protein-L-isoaspartate(D-aspartate) O-methyltransferase n=1 Tax=Tistrella mobilis TaxID=171437 RepID=UPI00355725EB
METLAEAKIKLLMQLRSAGITDTRVLKAIETVPREIFVPTPLVPKAYANRALPIGQGQTISQPEVVALMTQALELGDRHKVLEIGTGSGYQTAILSRLARRVYTIERHRSLAREAQTRFGELAMHNVVNRIGDGMRGWPEQAPFDRIIVTAASDEVPEELLDQLSIGGLMVMPVGAHGREQRLMKLIRNEDGVDDVEIARVRFVPLMPGVPREDDPGSPAG